MPFDKDDLDRLRKKDPTLQHIKAPSSDGNSLISTADIEELIAASEGNSYFNSLSINEQYLTPECVALIATKLNLKILRLRNCYLSDEHFAEFANNKTIEELDIGYNKNVTDISMITIAKMPALVNLAADFNAIGDNGALELANHDRLRQLNLSSNQLGNVGVEKLLANNKLIYLDLRFNKYDPSLRQAVKARALHSATNSHSQASASHSALFKPVINKTNNVPGTVGLESKNPETDSKSSP